jgi:hypothetical protein
MMSLRIWFTVALTGALLTLAAPANATHIACGDLITGTIVLDSDVVCPDGYRGSALYVRSSNVTLWTAGHSIMATGTTPAIGIDVIDESPRSQVHIRGGGSISGFLVGVLGNVSDSSVRNITITSSRGGDGVRMDGARNFVYRSIVTNLLEPSGSSAGIVMSGSEAYVWGNVVSGWAEAITVNSDKARVVLNTVRSCDTSLSGSVGIAISGYYTRAVAANNTVSGCEFGIAARGAPGSNPGDYRGNGRFRGNQLTSNAVGLAVGDMTAIVARNTANANSGTGIRSELAGTLVEDNAANDNGAYGINAAPGTIDGGGNTATGNGISDCVNVSCP